MRRADPEEALMHRLTDDLRAPMDAIRSAVEWLEEDLTEDISEEMQDRLRIMDQSARRMQRMLDGLLEHSQVLTRPVWPEWFQLREAFVEVASAMKERPLLHFHGAEPFIFSERERFCQVVGAILLNAVIHGGASRVDVEMSLVGDAVELLIWDDGVGFEAEAEERAFELFYTTKSASDPEHVGLGLTLAERIVERLGGALRIESACPAMLRLVWPQGEGVGVSAGPTGV